MSLNKEILLVPFWIQDILRRNNMELKDCLDFSKIHQVVSPNELAEFIVLQGCYGILIDMKNDGTIGLGADLSRIWHVNIGDTRQELHAKIDGNILPLCDSIYPELKTSIHTRLFSEGISIPQRPNPFVVYDLSETVVGVVINPGHFICGNNGKWSNHHQKALLDTILKVLYVYNTFSEVAKTSLFTKYLELLVAGSKSSFND